MKKSGVLNSHLSKVIASMGHTDKLVICDCGLPIPKGSELVDLSLILNIPRFMDTLKAILQELRIEKAIIAEELINNSSFFTDISNVLVGVEIDKVPHEKFKAITREEGNIVFVKTGEATPYANIILISGVVF